MKKTIGYVSAIALTAAATPAAFAHSNFAGFYVGAQGGFGTQVTKAQQQDATNPNDGQDAEFSGTGFVGGLLAGWGMTMEAFYFGFNLAWAFSGISGENKQFTGETARISMCDMFTAMVRLGYVWDSALLYVALGWANAKWELKNPGHNYDNPNSDTRHSGFVCAMGAEMPVAEVFFIGIETAYAMFGEKKYTRNIGGAADTRYKVCPNVFTFMLRGVWRFQA